MKNTIIILSVIIAFAACKPQVIYRDKPQIVYRDKPTVNDSTVLKAELKVKEWNILFSTIYNKARVAAIVKDTTRKKAALDTIRMAIAYIDKNISDTSRNPILKK